MSATRRRASTTTNTAAAHQTMSRNSASVAPAKSDRGAKVDCGNGPPQPRSQSAAEVNHHRYRGTGAGNPRVTVRAASGTLARPGFLVHPGPAPEVGATT